MTVGEMWDESKVLSKKREQSVGKDYVKVNAEENYKKLTGKPHPEAVLPKSKYIQ